MAAAGVMPLKPLTLQAPTGTYGTVPPPSGSRLSAPQFYAKPGQLTTTPNTVAPPRMASAAPQSPPAPFSPPPAAGGAPPRSAPPTFNPSPAGPSGVAPVPGGFNPATLNAAPTVPRGNVLAPPPAAPAPAGIVPPGTSAVSGGEVPYHVGTGPSDQTSSMLSKLATEAGRQLDQPTVWDDPLAKQIKDSQTAGINANYDVAGRHLDASLADRGINYSTIAGGDIMDLEKQRAGALSSVDADIAAQRANSLAAGRSAAFSNARGVFGDSSSADQTARNNQVGERGYTDELRNKAQNDALATTQLGETYGRQNDQDFQTILNQLNSAGNTAQTGASGIYGSQANGYGSSQATDQSGLSDLAQLAAQYFGVK